MSAIILVRHALPEVRPGVASRLWGLSERAREDCVLLAHALPPRLAPIAWTSAEKKAHETATVIGLRRGLLVQTDAGFREVDRPDAWVEDDRESTLAYLAGADLPGWEPRELAVGRFADALARARATAGDGDLVVVSHGLALALYLASVAVVEPTAFWDKLTFPDVWRVEPGAGQPQRLFSGV